MASSLVPQRFKYDVFLSFRGEDTRKTFVDHLYYALQHKGVITYKDDERIVKGERISDHLTRSIEESRFHIIVFSKNYASSSWCLQELVKIMECQKTKEQTAYPIFYDVEPTEIRNQRGAVGEAFAQLVAKHEKGSRMLSFLERFTGKMKRKLEDVDLEKEEDVGRWRDALKEAAGLAGMELNNTFNGHEAKCIQKIVEDVTLKLHYIGSSVDGKLVGMETRVKNVVSSLEIGSDDIRSIGIKGIGGGGKTTLARAVFDHISIRFEGKSFVENIKEVSKGYGMKELQKQVLKDVLNDQSSDVPSVSDGKHMMQKMMCSRKALIVLDDVDDIHHLEALAGELSWFKPGSKIIITTRDEQVLIAQRVKFIHDVNLLSDKEAICLFSKYAFGRDIPVQGYEELSGKVVHYAAGLPLTIKVLGSHLCGRSKSEWEDALERLKTIPLKETLEKLELSYNGLENDQKEILLDVVCILKGEMKDEAIRILESCGFSAQIGLRVLEQKSLITISITDGLRFHDHIEEMGWNIVRRLHPDEPSKHNRLWIKEEIEDILVNELGTEATRSIKLKNTDLHPEIIMKGLRKMKELRLLFVSPSYKTSILNLDGVSEYLPNALQSLNWRGYPFLSLPKSFQANKLVNLEMPLASISELWEGGEIKVLNKIRFLDLTCSNLRTLDLRTTPHLEKLNLQGCYDFFGLHMPIACPRLKVLNLYGSRVRNLNLGLTPNLVTLGLGGSKKVVELHMPVECPNLKSLYIGCSEAVLNLNLRMTPHLEELQILDCSKFVEFHFPVEWANLKSLNLSGSDVGNLNLGMAPLLEMLDVSKCNVVELYLPDECQNLKSLDLSGSKVSKLKLGITPHLQRFDLSGCSEFVELHLPVECPNLKSLDLSASKVSKLNLGITPHLEKLDLSKCSKFVEFHLPIECLNLKPLDLRCSKVSKLNLGIAPHIESLDISECVELVELHLPVECPNLKFLNLSGSKVSKLILGITPHLTKLDLSKCSECVELHLPIECPNLKSLDLSRSKLSKLKLGITPHLEYLHLEGCNELVELHLPAECPNLTFLNLSGSKVSYLNLEMTPHLEYLDLGGCNELVEIHFPAECPNLIFLNLSGSKVIYLNLEMTPHLQKLHLEGCNELVQLHLPVECLNLIFLNLSGSKVSNLNLEMTPHLGELRLEGCNEFVELHLPVECPNLRFLDVSGSKVSSLNLAMTPHLEELNLQGCYCLQEIHAPVGCLKELVYLNLIGSLRFVHFLVDKRYKLVRPNHVPTLELTANSVDICPLHPNSNLPKFELQCKYVEPVSSWSGNVEKLISFGICTCTNLESFSASICGLQHLKELTLEGNISEVVPKDLWQLESLEKQTLRLKEIKHLPNNICMLKHLKNLVLDSCWLLEQLPMDLCRLECLEELQLRLTDCIQLRQIPNSICNMKCLRHLHLSYCSQVKELEKELGCLECACTNLEPFLASICGLQHIRELTLEGSIPEVPKDLYKIESLEKLSLRMKELKHLPDSICMMKYLKRLDLTSCISLQDIPNNICNMECLANLNLRNCIRLEKLPEEVGSLKSLNQINIKGVGMSCLPQSIHQLKGLRIIGSGEQLKSYGFTSLKEMIPGDKSWCYVTV